MQLQRRSAHRRGDWPFDGFRHGFGFCFSGGDQHDVARFENSADSHGDCGGGHFFAAGEIAAIVGERRAAQSLGASARGEARGRLVEANVAVAPDSEDLQVDAACLANGRFVAGAIFLVAGLNAAVGNMDLGWRNIDVGEKILVHEAVKAVRMVGSQADVLVEIEGHYLRKIQSLLAMHARQLAIHSDSRAAGGQTEDQSRIASHPRGDNPRRRCTHAMIVSLQKDEHARITSTAAILPELRRTCRGGVFRPSRFSAQCALTTTSQLPELPRRARCRRPFHGNFWNASISPRRGPKSGTAKGASPTKPSSLRLLSSTAELWHRKLTSRLQSWPADLANGCGRLPNPCPNR